MPPIERSKEQIAFSEGLKLYRDGKFAEAAEAYTRALGDWDNEDVYRSRGWAYRKSGQPEKALADWQHVPEFAIARARALIELGRDEDAVPEIKLHLKKYADPDEIDEAKELLAAALTRLGRADEAGKLKSTARSKAKAAASTLEAAQAIPARKKNESYDAYAARLLAAAGLGKHAKAIDAARVPGVLLVPSKKKPVVGGSRIGGLPDLAKGAKWPAHKKAPMLFVLQVRLEDVTPLLPKGALPKAGLLSFFVCEGRAHDEYLDAVAVLMTPAKAKLAPLAQPAALTRLVDGKQKKAPFGARALDAQAARKLENPSALKKLPDDVRARYSANVFEPALAAFPGAHQLLGVRDRSYDGTPKGAGLLLQVVTEPSVDMHWGDDDTISVFAPRAGFAKAAFNKATITLGD